MPDFFDAAIVAKGLGGLICALSLASKGAKVFLAAPQRFQEPNILFDGEDRGFFRPVFLSIGIWNDGEKRIVCPAIAYQVALPGRRLDISTDPTELLQELRREYPEHKEELAALLLRLNERGELLRAALLRQFFRERRIKSPGFLTYRKFRNERLSSLFAEFNGSHPYLPLFQAQTLWWTGAFSSDPFALATAFHLGSLEGAFRMSDGVYHFLKEKLLERSGVISEGEPIRELFFNGKTLSGLAIGDTRVDTPMIATDTSIDSLVPFLPFPLQKKTLRKSPTSKHRSWRHCFHFLIYEQGIPEGMEDEVLYVPEEGELRGKNLLRITVQRKAPSPRKDKDMVLMHVSCLSMNEIEDISGELISALQKLMPFANEKGVGIIPADDPSEKDLLFYHTNPTVFTPKASSPRLPLKGFFHCGGTLFPSLGMEGEALAGYYCAQVMSRKI